MLKKTFFKVAEVVNFREKVVGWSSANVKKKFYKYVVAMNVLKMAGVYFL